MPTNLPAEPRRVFPAENYPILGRVTKLSPFYFNKLIESGGDGRFGGGVESAGWAAYFKLAETLGMRTPRTKGRRREESDQNQSVHNTDTISRTATLTRAESVNSPGSRITRKKKKKRRGKKGRMKRTFEGQLKDASRNSERE